LLREAEISESSDLAARQRGAVASLNAVAGEAVVVNSTFTLRRGLRGPALAAIAAFG